MLDLTLRLFTGDSSRNSARDSSVVNAYPSSGGYFFNILNNISKQTVVVDDSQENENVCSKTIQFFQTESAAKANSTNGQGQARLSVSLRKNEGLNLNLNSKPADDDCGSANQTNEPEIQQYRPPVKKNRRGPRTTSSLYRGVTFYRRTGRWESHIWDCGTGRQVYLGGFDTAPAAARAYDLAAIRFRGADAYLNFPLDNYRDDVKHMNSFSKDEFVMHLRSRFNTPAVVRP